MHAVHSNYILTMNVWYIFTVWTLDFALIIYVTKIRQFHVYNFDMEQGQFRRSWS